MIESTTIARPYAKAAFDFAMEQKSVIHWQSMLALSAEVSRDKKIIELLLSTVNPDKIADIFIMICDKELDNTGQNLIRVMARNRRLILLPYVFKHFLFLRSIQEKIIEVDVISSHFLQKNQLKKISIAIGKHLSSKIVLNCKIDPSIIAGIVIRIGDRVLDGSLQNRFERLTNILQT